MAGIKETLDAQIDAHDAKLAAADGEKASLEAGMADACANHGVKSDDLIGKKKCLAELTTAEANAANVLRNAEVNLADCDSELVKAAEQKRRMEEMMAEAFAKLKVGEDRAQLKGFLKTAAEYLKQTEVSAELFAAAVSKAPSDRGTFDNIIISTVEEDIKKLIDKCGEIIASGETTKHDRTMTVEAARSALTEALKAKEVAKEECQVALNAEKESSDVLKRAKQALKKFGPSMKALAGEMKVLKSRRKHFVEGPLACLTSLQAVESARNDAELEEGEALAAGNKALAEAAAPEAEAAVPEVGAAVEAVSEIPLQEQQHAETA
jgi:chromosome segregation ATPase